MFDVCSRRPNALFVLASITVATRDLVAKLMTDLQRSQVDIYRAMRPRQSDLLTASIHLRRSLDAACRVLTVN